jgi:hypothetical protein
MRRLTTLLCLICSIIAPALLMGGTSAPPRREMKGRFAWEFVLSEEVQLPPLTQGVLLRDVELTLVAADGRRTTRSARQRVAPVSHEQFGDDGAPTSVFSIRFGKSYKGDVGKVGHLTGTCVPVIVQTMPLQPRLADSSIPALSELLSGLSGRDVKIEMPENEGVTFRFSDWQKEFEVYAIRADRTEASANVVTSVKDGEWSYKVAAESLAGAKAIRVMIECGDPLDLTRDVKILGEVPID